MMLQERIRQHHQASRLEQTIAAMPEYPIYQVSPGCYVIYVAGLGYVFDSEAAARMRQLRARAEWLRTHGDAIPTTM
jgi:hypothetical protein